MISVVSQLGFEGFAGIEFIEQRAKVRSEGQAPGHVGQGLFFIGGHVFFLNRVQIAHPGFGEIVNQAHDQQMALIHFRYHPCQGPGDAHDAKGVLGDRLVSRSEELIPGALNPF